jgi:zinc transport system permease protein
LGVFNLQSEICNHRWAMLSVGLVELSHMWEWWVTQGLPGLLDGMSAVLPGHWSEWRFQRYALLECILLAPICAAMGVKVVNFRMAFFSDAIAHSAFAGVAFGYLLSGVALFGHVDPRITLIGFGLLVGLGIAMVRRKTDLSTDTVIGVFFSSVVALGIAIITMANETQSFERYLYGDILTVDETDLALSLVLAVLVVGYMLFSYNSMTLIGLNDELAQSRRVSVRLHDYCFAVLLALVVTTSIRTAGILLVTALLVVPAAAARNIARSAAGMFWWAVLLGLVSGVCGVVYSFTPWFDQVGTSAIIILTAAFLFVLSFFSHRDN